MNNGLNGDVRLNGDHRLIGEGKINGEHKLNGDTVIQEDFNDFTLMEQCRGSLDLNGWRASMCMTRKSSEASQERDKKGMFIDATAMKEKLRQNMIKPEYDVCNFYKTSGFCQLVARSSVFGNATLAVIAFNAIWIAVDTDLNHADMLLLAHPVFQIAEHFFCAYFTFEWTIRFGAFELKRNVRRDAWFVFDSFMVMTMVLETWVMTIVLLATGSANSGSGGLGDVSILRLLRLMRLSRMARMAKLLRSMPELLILIKGMLTAMKSVMYTLTLLAILNYIFAIAFRQLTTETTAGDRYFSSVPVSMHTLLLEGTFMDSPGAVIALLGEESIVYVIMFYVFTCVGSLMVMNMLIGVLCEVVSAVAATEKEQIAVATVKDGFMEIIEKGGLDTDGDSMISRREFEAILNDPDATRLLQKVNVDVYGLVDLASFIFTQEDDSTQEKQLTFTEFMEIVLSLRGNNSATVKDVVDMRQFIKQSLSHLEERLVHGRSGHNGHKQSKSGKPTCLESLSEHDVFAACQAPVEESGTPRKGPPPQALPSTKIWVRDDRPARDEVDEFDIVLPGVYWRDEASPAPPLLTEDPPLPPGEAPPVPLGLAGRSPPPEGPPRPRRLSLPDFEAKSKLLREVCVKTLRLEGVLAGARNEIGRFIDGLPIPGGGFENELSGEPSASSSHDRHPPPDQDNRLSAAAAAHLLPSELRELQELRLRLTRLGQALQVGLEDLHNAQKRI